MEHSQVPLKKNGMPCVRTYLRLARSIVKTSREHKSKEFGRNRRHRHFIGKPMDCTSTDYKRSSSHWCPQDTICGTKEHKQGTKINKSGIEKLNKRKLC